MSCGCSNNMTAGVIGTLGGQLVRGFSAYEIAVKNGYKGTEAEWLASLRGEELTGRISSLNDTKLAFGNVIEIAGLATYYDDVTEFSDYGLTEPGWYAFARIQAPAGVTVTTQTKVSGAAGYIIAPEENHIDVAVRFVVAALSVPVIITWDDTEETFVFKNTDLAVRNLDYRVTFYVYDSDEFAHFHFALASGSFAAGTNYYVKQDGDYVPAEVTAGETVPEGYYVETPAYTLTSDANFAEGTTYYIKQGDDYVRANVTVGDPVAADTYYVQTTEYVRTEDETFEAGKTYYSLVENAYVPAEVTAGETVPEGYYVETPAYTLTSDANFAEGTTYYIKQGDDYVRANVTVGDPVAADTYYVQTTEYVRTEDETFEAGKTYYSLVENAYVPAEVTAGEAIPNYYVHDKLTFEGMVRNVTYNFNEVVDCPVEFILPEVTDEEHGFWFEVRCLFAGQYSMTLVPPSPDIKIATEHTQQEQKGINMINLLYTAVAGTKVWRIMNTRSTVPA